MNSESIQSADPSAITRVWRPSATLLMLSAVILLVSAVPFLDGLSLMWGWWVTRPEYSHGILMPVLAAFLIWQQRDRLERAPLKGSWYGLGVVAFSALILIFGKLASVVTLIQYAYVIALGGLMLSQMGTSIAPRLLVPFAILVLMIPLPEFLFQNLTAGLQLLSSKLGVAFIRLFGVSVFLEGNVIDLGSYRLEVAEACSGLRYLFPLMTLGFIMAYFFKAAWWKRTIVFLSSIPVTILMNSLRIGAIGLMVDRWGASMAEGFLHDFEGWAMFMVSGAVLLFEIMLLSRVGSAGQSWRSLFAIDLPPAVPKSVQRLKWRPSAAFVVSCAVLGALALVSVMMPQRVEKIPARTSFTEFPNQIDGWKSRRNTLESVYLNALKLDDYLLADYARPDGQAVNLYMAWYDSQRGGQSAHSPRTCIPGGGWRITSLTRQRVPEVALENVPLSVNRVLIENGSNKQLVYYWFQQRGRVVTNEYMVKLYLFWDALTRQRTDGALVRLSIAIPSGQSVEQVEPQLVSFLRVAAPKFGAYVPN